MPLVEGDPNWDQAMIEPEWGWGVPGGLFRSSLWIANCLSPIYFQVPGSSILNVPVPRRMSIQRQKAASNTKKTAYITRVNIRFPSISVTYIRDLQPFLLIVSECVFNLSFLQSFYRVATACFRKPQVKQNICIC